MWRRSSRWCKAGRIGACSPRQSGWFSIGQFLEGNVISPKLVGDKVGLHPVWLIFALLAFGSLLGFTGLIIAVPVAAAAGVILRFAIYQYRGSELYTNLPEAHALILTKAMKVPEEQ